VATTLDDTPVPRADGGRRRCRHVFRGVAVAVVVLLGAVGLAVGDALSAPGNDPAAAKLAEWGRDHGFGDLVTCGGLQQRLPAD
jgi:hypothetical protein